MSEASASALWPLQPAMRFCSHSSSVSSATPSLTMTKKLPAGRLRRVLSGPSAPCCSPAGRLCPVTRVTQPPRFK